MAKDSLATGLPLTHNRLALLQNLTRAITEALVADDLDRADYLLEQRWLALQRLNWTAPGDEDLEGDLRELWELDRYLLNYCRKWRDTVEERLEAITTCHNLRLRYHPPYKGARFVDMRE